MWSEIKWTFYTVSLLGKELDEVSTNLISQFILAWSLKDANH